MRGAKCFIRRVGSISLFLACAFVEACSTDTAPTDPIEPQPTSGALELTIHETGARPDADGYLVAVTRETNANPSIRFSPLELDTDDLVAAFLRNLAPGTYAVRVEGLAAHCSVSGLRAFTIEAGKTTPLDVGIFCPGPGAILVTTLTRGRDIPTAEYGVSITGDFAMEVPIGTTDSLLVGEEELPAGAVWFVELRGVPENCWVDRPPQAVPNLRGATVRIEYAVVCIPSSSRIAYELGGIYLTGGSQEILVAEFRGLPHGGPSLSPDRSRVVFSTLGADLGGHDLVLAETDGGGGGWLTGDGWGSSVGSQAWSPDGSRIVFARTIGETSDIYVLDADGETRLTFAGFNTSPAWSPDGTSIAFCRFEGDPFDVGSFAIYHMSATDGSGLVKLVGGACDPAWSPRGEWIAFTTWNFSSSQDLGVVSADGSNPRVLGLRPPLLGSRRPSWSPDGTQIAFNGAGNRIWIVDFDGSTYGEAFPYRQGTAPSWR